MDGRVEVKQGRKGDARQMRRERKGIKEEARQGGGRKRGSALRTRRGIGVPASLQNDTSPVENMKDIYMVTKWSTTYEVLFLQPERYLG